MVPPKESEGPERSALRPLETLERWAVVEPGQAPGEALPNPPFQQYWPRVEAYLRFTTQDTGNVENYVVCWREVERVRDDLFGVLGKLPLRSWTRATALRTVCAIAAKADGSRRSLSTLACKVNAMAAVFRRASREQHPMTDAPLFPRQNPFREKMALLREALGNREIQKRSRAGEVRPYSRDELTRLLAIARGRSWSDSIILLLCARCGLRRSEAIGLQWSDFRRANRVVMVRRKASKPQNGAVEISTQLKTESSRRSIPVPMDAWHEVELWRKHCVTQAGTGIGPYSRYLQPSRRHPAREPSLFLFPPRRPSNTDAPVLDPDAWAQRLRGDLARAEIDVDGTRNFAHNLRHTYASELLARGANLSQVAKLLGDSLAVAERCYAHLVQSRRLRELTDSLSDDM